MNMPVSTSLPLGAEKQTTEKVWFLHLSSFSYKLFTSIAYKLKQLLSYFTHGTTLLSS